MGVSQTTRTNLALGWGYIQTHAETAFEIPIPLGYKPDEVKKVLPSIAQRIEEP